ncbi:hypothetical protein DP107_05570 [Haloglomus irregulare]|jgi:hypothetical protein|uniref:Uncharacterized protein n=1 Tax=Haloglomus irregulare TaxID=2234134 RepID=A0A554ND48_9EURY|nr:hypothetical protein [Haloglomus irregulare]TSD15317.1 hypothetical protein DP107_05570 [Haloglomus irregulare]
MANEVETDRGTDVVACVFQRQRETNGRPRAPVMRVITTDCRGRPSGPYCAADPSEPAVHV